MSKVTDCDVYPIANPKSKIIAIGRIELNGDIVIDGVKVIKGEKGLFVGMPSKKSEDKTWSDVAYASTKELKEAIKEAVLAKYHDKSDGSSQVEETSDDDDLPF